MTVRDTEKWLHVPAPAGVIPSRRPSASASETCPRTRGGDPKVEMVITMYEAMSPHPRG